jgi:hypothetical protein
MMTLTKKLIYAAGRDAAERSKRNRGLKVWDEAACEAYDDEFQRLFKIIGGPDGWINLADE